MKLPAFLTEGHLGEILVKGHRVFLLHIVEDFNQGFTLEQLAEEYDTVPREVLAAVVTFYRDNKTEVDAYVAQCHQQMEQNYAAGVWYADLLSPDCLGEWPMAPTMTELGIDRLSVDDRLALVQEIWDSIAAESDLLPLSDEEKRLLDRRLAELDANPGNVLTWDEIKRRIRENQ